MNNDKIDLGEWAGEIISMLIDFRNHWYNQSARSPEHFPLALTRGDWDEQFNSFQASRKKGKPE